jgi:hypothetical protein
MPKNQAMKLLNASIGIILLILQSYVIAAPGRAMRFHAASIDEARTWQNAAREKLFALMMGGQPPARCPLEAKVLKRVEMPGSNYVLEELTLQTLPDRRAHVWLARPAQPKAKTGAVLALNGHGGNGEQVVRGLSLYWYGRAIAEMGCIVIAPDIGQHELQHTNWSLMGERTWDALRCLDYAAGLPEVDAERLAVAGLSLGGETTMYVAALDQRVKAACSSGWLTTVTNMKNGHCPCFNFPGLEENFDFADIFACVAPRPLVCELGEQERAPGGFPVAIGRSALEEIRRAYRVFNAETNLSLTVHPAGHVLDGRDFWPKLRIVLGQPSGTASGPGAANQFEAFPAMRSMWGRELVSTDGTPGDRRRAQLFRAAEKNGRLANEALFRCRRYVDGWLACADPATGLIPRNLRESRDFWNGRDSAADNYPFIVLTASITDRPLMEGRLLDILRAETRLTSRLGCLPDDYSFSSEPVESAADWIDTQTRMMWAIQKPDGIIEGWHGDGNFARTSLMYALWKTQGVTLQPWRSDVRFGAVREGDAVFLSLTSDQPWTGRVIFDRPRHKLLMHLPLDYSRINQFPEWFTLDSDACYGLKSGDQPTHETTGTQLAEGILIELKPEVPLLLEARRL